MSVMEFINVKWPEEYLEVFKVFSYVGSVNKVAFGLSCFYDSDVKIVYLA